MFPCELHFEELGVVQHLAFEYDAVAELIVPYPVPGLVLLLLWFDWFYWLLGYLCSG